MGFITKLLYCANQAVVQSLDFTGEPLKNNLELGFPRDKTTDCHNSKTKSNNKLCIFRGGAYRVNLVT